MFLILVQLLSLMNFVDPDPAKPVPQILHIRKSVKKVKEKSNLSSQIQIWIQKTFFGQIRNTAF